MNPNTYHDLWLPKQYLESAHGQYGSGDFDPGDFDFRGRTEHWGTHRLYGQGHERMFPSGALTTKPFPNAPPVLPNRNNDAIKEAVIGGIRGTVHPEAIDPRWLHMSQSSVTSSGVGYYLGDEWKRGGETYADQGKAGNKHPLVYEHSGLGQRIILAGHHRAAAALAEGRPLHALVVRH